MENGNSRMLCETRTKWSEVKMSRQR